MSTPPRVLILTAGFGEGHNSAAKGLAAAWKGYGEVLLCDPCAEGIPRSNAFLKKVYASLIKHYPKLWALFFSLSDRKSNLCLMNKLLKGVGAVIVDKLKSFDPDIVISTYPIYTGFVENYMATHKRPFLNYVVITDSLVIHHSWIQVHPTAWLVTDSMTRDVVLGLGVPSAKVVDVGFPVNPELTKNKEGVGDSWEPGQPIRVLFFASQSKSRTQADLIAILESRPDVMVTVVLGRHVRALYHTVFDLKQKYKDRVSIFGWTKRVPELLINHHVVVSKAGGATVHEVLNARCPMLVNQVVYGQEEGNVNLLEKWEVGALVVGADALKQAIQKMFGGETPTWFEFKSNLKKLPFLGGAPRSVRFFLDEWEKTFKERAQ